MSGWIKKVHLSVFGPYIENMPYKYKLCIEKFRQRNPDIEIKIWNLDDARKLIYNMYPWALSKYDSMKWDIQRSDMSRPAILHSEGGVYMDLDYKTRKPMVEIFRYLDEMHPGGKVFLNQKSKRKNRARLTNSLMISKELNHPFWIDFLKQIVSTKGNGRGLTRHAKIISSCGPGAITKTFHQYIKNHKGIDIVLLDPNVFNPCSFCSRTDKCGKGEGVLAVHTFDSSWHGLIGHIYKHVYCNGIAYCICIPIVICIIAVIIIIFLRLQKCKNSCAPCVD